MSPLLTIAIPTFNRAPLLAELLEILLPQIAAVPIDRGPIEVLIANNASPDNTIGLVQSFQQRFPTIDLRLHTHPANIGSDANFVFCYEQARGTFFWLCGDDDLILPGTINLLLSHIQLPTGAPAELDIVYATSTGFYKDYLTEIRGDPLHRRFHTITDARTFITVVNIMLTFITSIVINRSRLESIPHEAPRAFIGTNLVQLSWSLPLLLQHRRSLVLWERPVACRLGNVHGYSLGDVFGANLMANVNRLLPNRPDLTTPLLNFTLRRWFPSMIMDIRRSGNTTMNIESADATLRALFHRNPRYWLFIYPALRLPLPLAKLFTQASAALSKLIYIAHLPGFWRRET